MARMGTKSVSKQNIRLVNDKPLLYYIINTAKKLKHTDIFVSTDSDEIKEIAQLYGVHVIKRPRELSRDTTPAEKIAYHAISHLNERGMHYEKCLLASPHFPLINLNSIKKFFSLLNSDIRTIFGYERQEATTYCRVIGKANSRITKLIPIRDYMVKRKKIISFYCQDLLMTCGFTKPEYGIQLEEDEIFYPENYHHFGILEKILDRKRILVRLHGSRLIGLGHVYNMLTILNQFRNEDILVMMDKKNSLGLKKLKENLYNVKTFANQREFFKTIDNFKPNIIFNDILNTKINYIKKLKKQNIFVVNFEDLGSGRKYADLVFNPIFESKDRFPNEFYGSNYACVRDEFRIFERKQIRKSIEKIVITLGGTDYNNNTCKILETIRNSKTLKKITIDIILGLGFVHKTELNSLISIMKKDGYKINVIRKAELMSKHMIDADFVVTSNGRTVFEAASLKLPIIALSVNSREKQHDFVRESKVGFHIDFIKNTASDELLSCIEKMFHYTTRKRFIANLEKIDLRRGTDRVIKIILEEYDKRSVKSF